MHTSFPVFLRTLLKKTIPVLVVLGLLCCVFCLFAAAESDPNAPVVEFSICARVIFFGHVWLYFRNITDHDVRIGPYNLAPGRGVSVGTMSLSRGDGPGVYYNVEAYMTHRLGGFGAVGRTMTLNRQQLDVVSEMIVFNNSWTLSNNCCAFATRIWNRVAPDHIGYNMLPVVVKGRIGSGACPKMDDPSRNDVYRMHGIGWGVSLSCVNNRSLIMYIG